MLSYISRSISDFIFYDILEVVFFSFNNSFLLFICDLLRLLPVAAIAGVLFKLEMAMEFSTQPL